MLADQMAVLEEDLAQSYDNLFIETCAPWVVPYIGDLLQTTPLIDSSRIADTGHRCIALHRSARADLPAADRATRPRRRGEDDLLRRRKTTLPMLEQLAGRRDRVGGSCARVLRRRWPGRRRCAITSVPPASTRPTCGACRTSIASTARSTPRHAWSTYDRPGRRTVGTTSRTSASTSGDWPRRHWIRCRRGLNHPPEPTASPSVRWDRMRRCSRAIGKHRRDHPKRRAVAARPIRPAAFYDDLACNITPPVAPRASPSSMVSSAPHRSVRCPG